jgi:hypothetical protein
MKAKSKRSKSQSHGLDPKKRRYSDGHPLDEVHYIESKIILKGDRFTSVDSFRDFAKLVRSAAEEVDIDFSRKGFKDALPKIREVLFLDTADFRLYNHAFILRRRLNYEHGFAVGVPEFVFKFRHPDLQKTAEMDVRPKLGTNYEIKFKAEALPLKDQIGGVRLLYSHNVEFSFSPENEVDRTPMATLVRMFPPLRSLHASGTDTVKLVNHTAVEEVLLDIGRLNFGKGIRAKANVAVWRTRGDEKPLVGEFAFQCKFRRADERHAVAMKRGERFFLALQNVAKDWVALGTTKTGAVYRLKGNPPQAHE